VLQNKKEALNWYLEAAKNSPKGLVKEKIIKELTDSLEGSTKENTSGTDK
jgi:hypothetical protein